MDKSKNPLSRNKVGAASNSIADKQLREAIASKVLQANYAVGDKQLEITTDQLLALFHTYGNRERLDELKKALEYSDVHLDLVTGKPYRTQSIEDRIAELNREVES